MDLLTYIKSLPDEPAREAFGVRCGSSVRQLRNIGYGLRPCAPLLAVAIERESGRAVTRPDLRPDDWRLMWPELATEPKAAKAKRVPEKVGA